MMTSGAPQVLAIKATFDGERIILPDELEGAKPGAVIVIFQESEDDRSLWLRAQESAFAKVWDNPEDAAYDDV